MNGDAFGRYHPIVNFIFFGGVIIFTMIFFNPVFLITSLLASACYAIYLKGKKGAKFTIILIAVAMIFSSIMNIFASHRGITTLFYMGKSPVTLEALTYGFFTGIMFASVILWFYSFLEVITSDKFIYLFGSIAPSSSLIFTMVMSFIPRYRQRVKKIREARKALGMSMENNFREKMRENSKMLSTMTSWCLESAIDTSDSMRARGYGRKGRKKYSNYKLEGRDILLTVFMLAMAGIIIAAAIAKKISFLFFPAMGFQTMDNFSGIAYCAFALLCFIAVLIDGFEVLRWKQLRRQI